MEFLSHNLLIIETEIKFSLFDRALAFEIYIRAVDFSSA